MTLREPAPNQETPRKDFEAESQALFQALSAADEAEQEKACSHWFETLPPESMHLRERAHSTMRALHRLDTTRHVDTANTFADMLSKMAILSLESAPRNPSTAMPDLSIITKSKLTAAAFATGWWLHSRRGYLIENVDRIIAEARETGVEPERLPQKLSADAWTIQTWWHQPGRTSGKQLKTSTP